MSGTVELLVVERAGQRLAIPASRVAMVGDLPSEKRAPSLQEQLGQPPLGEDERCLALAVRTTDGPTIVQVAGRVTIAEVSWADMAALPPPLAGVCPVTAVVFGDELSMLVLDVDVLVARRRARQTAEQAAREAAGEAAGELAGELAGEMAAAPPEIRREETQELRRELLGLPPGPSRKPR